MKFLPRSLRSAHSLDLSQLCPTSIRRSFRPRLHGEDPSKFAAGRNRDAVQRQEGGAREQASDKGNEVNAQARPLA